MNSPHILKKFLIWRVKHLSNQQFIFILSILVGLATGFSAVIIKNSVHLIQQFLVHGFVQDYYYYLYFIYPTIGIFLTVLFIKYILKRPVGHGIPSTLYAISKRNGIIPRNNMFSSIIPSALTVGFGGSAGLEGPTVSTGAAIGSNIGQVLHLNHQQIILLLGCACAGALSAIFKAPIAAIVFALEVIMLDLTMASLVPLLVASLSATLTSYFFLGQDVLYPFNLGYEYVMLDFPVYILLGITTGMVSLYFIRTYIFITESFERIKSRSLRLLGGGLSLGVLIFFLPSLYGEGYEEINQSLQGDLSYLFENTLFSFQENALWVMGFLLAVILFKVIATSLTFGIGGIGGVFAPSLFIGANTGLLLGKILNYFDFKDYSESSFALVGMAGLIAGVLHAPLTAIFLIAEITGGYSLILPLMITATISYTTIKYFQKNSIYTIQLAKRKELITHHKDKAVLSRMKVVKLIENNFTTVNEDANLGELVKIVAKSKRNIFPVIDKENVLQGFITLDGIRDIMFKPELYESVLVRNLMTIPQTFVGPNDSVETVAEKFHASGKYNIPVLRDGKYLGFISKANLFSSYRKLLKRFSEE